MPQAGHHVVDDLRGGHYHACRRDLGKKILLEFIVDITGLGDQRSHPLRIQDIKSVYNAAQIPLLEDVGIPVQELG